VRATFLASMMCDGSTIFDFLSQDFLLLPLQNCS